MADIITSTPPIAAGFDYTTVSAETAHDLREAAATIRNLQRAAIEDVGRHLIAAKQSVEPGQFQQWCRTELGFEPRTAERCMRAAEFLEGKPSQLTHLPHDIIYKLSAPSAPADVVQAVVDAAISGAPMARAEIDAKLSDAREPERQDPRIVETRKAKVRPTREAAAARIAREQAERAREQEQRRREDQQRDARLRPVADQVVAALSADLLDEVQAILEGQDPWERHRFTDLLVAAIRAAPERAGDDADAAAEIVGAEEMLTEPVTAETIAPEPETETETEPGLPDIAAPPDVGVAAAVETELLDVAAVATPAPAPAPTPAPVQTDPTDPTGWKRMANQCLSSGSQFGPADLRLLAALTGLGSSTPTMAQVDRLEILHAGLPIAQGGAR